MTASVNHGLWSSRLTFILAATGAAVGLGNIWKFPYIMGDNGGGAFVLVYLACILTIGIPVMMGEVLIGRRGRANPSNAIGALAMEACANVNWKWVGAIAILSGFLILCFYCVVAGWSVAYVFKSASGAFQQLSSEQASAMFGQFIQSPVELIFWSTFVLIAIGVVIAKDLKQGIEKAVIWFMPAMLILLVIIALYAMVQGDLQRTLYFMFYPDFSKLTYAGVVTALGHAFFTLSLASGAMMIYGAYLPANASISKSVLSIALADTIIALIAGLAIYPVVFGNGLAASQGPGLVFVSLPIAFGNMFAGQLIGSMFFIMLSFAAFTSAISMVEAAVVWLMEKYNIRRAKASILIICIVWLMSLLTVFSFSGASWATFKLHFIGKDVGNFFELLDHLTSDILLPLGGMFTAIFVAWVMKKPAVKDEIKLSDNLFTIWFWILKWFTPFAVLFVFLNLIGVISL